MTNAIATKATASTVTDAKATAAQAADAAAAKAATDAAEAKAVAAADKAVAKLVTEFGKRELAILALDDKARVERAYAVRVLAGATTLPRFQKKNGTTNFAAIAREFGGSMATSASAKAAYKLGVENVLAGNYAAHGVPTEEEVNAANEHWDNAAVVKRGNAALKAAQEAEAKATADKAGTVESGDMGDMEDVAEVVTPAEALTITDALNALRDANKALTAVVSSGYELTADDTKRLAAMAQAFSNHYAKLVPAPAK